MEHKKSNGIHNGSPIDGGWSGGQEGQQAYQ